MIRVVVDQLLVTTTASVEVPRFSVYSDSGVRFNLCRPPVQRIVVRAVRLTDVCYHGQPYK